MSDGFKGLKLYNTLTRRKADFVPIDPQNVRVYVCGPTVYDLAHIGNARPVIVFDVLFRLLRDLYGAEHVTYVRNITDVDDKINARAARDFPDLPLNEAIRKVTETTNAQFQADVKALGCLEPTLQPRATEHIAEMIVMIEQLIAKGHAYAAEGHVLFDVKSWKDADGAPEYGKLSRRPLDDMIAGARVEVAPYKRDPMDFVLWKPSTAEEPGWESPWGRGRPGWHIECSAMSDKWLWQEAKSGLSPEGLAHPHEFDIHGGGIDLTFPHHENEVAQSRCAHGTEAMAHVWMHNGFLQVEGRKMAKSEGNFVTIHELLTGWNGYAWPGQVIRYAMLKTHYRQPLDFSFSLLTEAMKELSDFALNIWSDDDKWGDDDVKYILASDEFRNGEFIKALKDDLNTPRAIAELHKLSEMSRQNRQLPDDKAADPMTSNLLRAGLVLLGINLSREAYDPNWMQSQIQAQMESGFKETIQRQVEQRLAFLREKNFAEADRIRAELAEKGVQLMDYKDPETGERRTRWEAKR